MEANLREEATYARRLAEQYRLIEIQINQQIAQFYQSFADAEHITLAEAQQRLSKDDVRNYEALAKKYVEMAAADRRNGTDRTKEYFSKKANDQMRIYNAMMKINRLELLKAELGMAVDQAMMDIGEDMDGALTKRTDDELRRQAGILGKSVFHNDKDVASIVNGSFHNASWSERIWGNGEQLKANLNILLTQGLIQGRNPRELARTLRKSYDASRYEAERLMRTELARVQTDAQMESFKRNGYDQYEFIALGTACKACHDMDGKVFNVADGMPGENMPPVHPNCRCSTAAHFMAENDFVQMMRDKYGLDMGDREFTDEPIRGIINTRNMANGPRRSPFSVITKKEEKRIKREASEIGVPTSVLSFNTGSRTGYDESEDVVHIRGDIFPAKHADNANSIINSRSALAHEYYGHMLHNPSKFAVGDWRDEFQASYWAAINTPNLTAEERRLLMIDAYDRARMAGVKVEYNKKAKELIYGI